MGYLELRVPSLRTPDVRTVEVRLDGEPAGTVDLRVCEQCELVTVEQVRLPAEPAVRALWLLVDRLPHHRWTGTGPQADEFWDALPWWQGQRTPERCKHMLRSDAPIPAQRQDEAEAARPVTA